jgi:hypothetical protein
VRHTDLWIARLNAARVSPMPRERFWAAREPIRVTWVQRMLIRYLNRESDRPAIAIHELIIAAMVVDARKDAVRHAKSKAFGALILTLSSKDQVGQPA